MEQIELDLSPQYEPIVVDLQFSEAALRQLIRSYTYEAGVRNLEREIGAICRKVARRVAEGALSRALFGRRC